MCSGIIDRNHAEEIAKEQDAKKRNMISRIEPFEPNTPPFLDQKFHCPRIEKIVFLNDANLALFKGYKAAVSIRAGLQDRFEIHVVITGFKFRSAEALLFDLKSLAKEEINGK